MKLSSLIKEQMDIGDILYSKRDQIELDYGPRTFKTLQSSLMMDDEAYVRNWLIKKGYMDEEKSPFEEQIKDVIKKEIDECWKTYKQVGMKKKGNKMVPNCVPKNEEVEEGRKKKKCKPSKGKRFAKRVDGKCRSFGQKGKASDGGDRIRPGTKKAHAYCARSAKIKKCKNPPCANTLSRRKWKCQGSRSVPE